MYKVHKILLIKYRLLLTMFKFLIISNLIKKDKKYVSCYHTNLKISMVGKK